MPRIRIAIAGIGNCASSLVQGIHYYAAARQAGDDDATVGLMHRSIGGYRVEDIDVPADLATCMFFSAMLGGNAPHPDSMHAGDGYLVRDRQGALAGKLLIVADRILEGGRAEVTFDFLRL